MIQNSLITIPTLGPTEGNSKLWNPHSPFERVVRYSEHCHVYASQGQGKEATELCSPPTWAPDWILGDTRLGVILQQ